MAFVIDASATLPWCFEDQATAAADRLLFDLRNGDTAVVPAHWPLEVLNSLIVAVRRGRPREQVERFWSALSALRIRVGLADFSAGFTIHASAEQYRLTAYDAAYLDLAQRAVRPFGSRGSTPRGTTAANAINDNDASRRRPLQLPQCDQRIHPHRAPRRKPRGSDSHCQEQRRR